MSYKLQDKVFVKSLSGELQGEVIHIDGDLHKIAINIGVLHNVPSSLLRKDET